MDYIVVTSGRTGSQFLQWLMRNNGFGDPEEWFNPETSGFGDAVQNGTSTEQWLAATRQRQTRNDTFGVKLIVFQLDLMGRHMRPPEADRRAVVTRLFPDANYIFLYREDTYRQAVSFWRSETSGEWFRFHNEEHPPSEYVPVDIERIRALLRSFDESNRFWASFFDREQITPYVVSYERLVARPAQTLSEIADFLGVTLPDEPRLDVDTVQQADQLTERYVAELEAQLGTQVLARALDEARQARALDEARGVIAQIESSLSWRLTRPLRAGKALARRISGRPKHQ